MHECKFCGEDDCECLTGPFDCIGCRVCRLSDDCDDEDAFTTAQQPEEPEP